MITAKAARVNRGYTQEQCANAVGVTRSTYIKYVNGETAPSVNMAREIADFLKTNLNDLVFLPKI